MIKVNNIQVFDENNNFETGGINLLTPLFENGKLLRETSLKEIRELIYE